MFKKSDKNPLVTLIAKVLLFAFCAHMGEHVHALIQAAGTEIQATAQCRTIDDLVDLFFADDAGNTDHATHNHQYRCCNLSHLFSVHAAQVLIADDRMPVDTAILPQDFAYPPGKFNKYSANYAPEIFHPPAV